MCKTKVIALRPSRSECLFPVSQPTLNSGSGEFFKFLFRLCVCKNTVASGTGVCVSVVQGAAFALRDRF